MSTVLGYRNRMSVYESNRLIGKGKMIMDHVWNDLHKWEEIWKEQLEDEKNAPDHEYKEKKYWLCLVLAL